MDLKGDQEHTYILGLLRISVALLSSSWKKMLSHYGYGYKVCFLKAKAEVSIPIFDFKSAACHLIRKHVVTAWVWNPCKRKGQDYSHATHIQRAEANFSVLSWNYKCFFFLFLTTFCGTVVRKTSGHVSLTKSVIIKISNLEQNRQQYDFLKLLENMIIHFFLWILLFYFQC